MWKVWMTMCLTGILISEGVAAQSPSPKDADWIEYDRRLAANHKTVLPSAGVIPDAETAKSIALAVAIPIWGKAAVTSELPLQAALMGDTWTVIGDPHLHRGQTGGELIIQLDKRNGAVLSLLHTQ